MKIEKPKKKTIDWYGKKVTVPFDCGIYPDKQVTIANRFTGQKCYDAWIRRGRLRYHYRSGAIWAMGHGPGWTRLVQATFCRTIHGGSRLMVVWNTGAAAMRFRHNLKLNKKKRGRKKNIQASNKRALTNKRA